MDSLYYLSGSYYYYSSFCFWGSLSPSTGPPHFSLCSRPGLQDFVCLAVPVSHDSELVATLTRKMRDLEQQVRSQTDELLSKVGPRRGEGQGLV